MPGERGSDGGERPSSGTGVDDETNGSESDGRSRNDERVPSSLSEHYRMLVETVDDGVYSVDPDGRFTAINAGFAEIHGRSREELLGAHVSELLDAETIERLERRVGELLADGRHAGRFETEIERPDGERVCVETQFSLLEVDSGEYARVGVVRDVTERKRRERGLETRLDQQRVATELGQVALEAGNVATLLSTTVERVADVLDVDCCELLELDGSDEFLRLRAGVGWDEGLVGEATVGAERGSQAGYTLLVEEPVVVTDLEGDERFAGSHLHLDHDVTSGISAIVGPVDDPWGVLGAHTRSRRDFSTSDVNFVQCVATTLATAIRRAGHERELRKYETIVESVSDGVYAIDEDDRFSMVNEAYETLTGFDRSELIGSKPSLVVDDQVVERATEIEEQLRAGELESATLEAEIQAATGDTVQAEATFSILAPEGGPEERVGVVRDVTERTQFEETLRALYETTQDLFRTESVEEVGQRILDVAVSVLDLSGVAVYLHDESADRLYPATHSVDGVFVREELPTVPASDDGVLGRVYRRGRTERLEDVRSAPQFGGIVEESRAAVFASLGVHGVLVVEARDADTFDGRTTQLVELLAANAEVAYDRVVREDAIERQRERLAALNDLHGVVRDINVAMIERESRADVERVVVERLANSDSYAFAWIGAVDNRRGEVVLRAEAGVEGYLDDLTISLDPDGPEYTGPTARAIRTGETQVFDDIPEDAAPSGWRDRAESYGFLSTAAIPISFGGTLYGVLDVYADRRNAFQGKEGEVVGQLGGIVGHAINAIERKRALVTDEVVEVEFAVEGGLGELDVGEDACGQIEFQRAIPLEGGDCVVYGTAAGWTIDVLESLCERTPHWESLSIIAEYADDVRFELSLTEPPAIAQVAESGGRMHRATFEDGTLHFVVHLPPSADVRAVVRSLRELHPDANVIAQRRRSRPERTTSTMEELFERRLTKKQRRAIEAAYFAGFFEWPRDSTGEEVARSLGVSAPTFHEHLRASERAILSVVFGVPPSGDVGDGTTGARART